MSALVDPLAKRPLCSIPSNARACYATVTANKVLCEITYYLDGDCAVPVRVEVVGSDVTPWIELGSPSEEELAILIEEQLGETA